MKKIISYLMVVVLSFCMLTTVNIFAEERADDFEYEGVSMSISSDLALNFFVSEELVEKYEALTLHVSLNGYKEDIFLNEDLYSFTFANITPDLMANEISFKMTGEIDGTLYEGGEGTYSISTYLYAVLSGYDVKNVKSEDIKICRLVIDTLNYGAATQKYTNPAIASDKLINANLSSEWKEWRGDTEKTYTNVKSAQYFTIEEPSVAWKSVTLNLMDKVRMKVTFETASIDGLRIVIQNESEQSSEDATASEFVHVDGNKYSYMYSSIAPYQFSERLLFTLYDGDTAVSNTLSYSVESFIDLKKDSENQELRAMVKAIGNYGDSANKCVCFHDRVSTCPEVRAKCEQDGHKKYYECMDCGALFSDSTHEIEVLLPSLIIPQTGHDWDETEWKHDNTYHYHTCKKCGEKKDKEKHEYTNSKDNTCNICLGERTVDLPWVPMK